jgi:hypothetical protein
MRARRQSGGDRCADLDAADGCEPGRAATTRALTGHRSWTTPCLVSTLPASPKPHAIDALAVTPDGGTVFVAGAGGTYGGVCCVDARDPRRLRPLSGAAHSPRGAGGLGITVLALNPVGDGFYTGARDGEVLSLIHI